MLLTIVFAILAIILFLVVALQIILSIHNYMGRRRYHKWALANIDGYSEIQRKRKREGRLAFFGLVACALAYAAMIYLYSYK